MKESKKVNNKSGKRVSEENSQKDKNAKKGKKKEKFSKRHPKLIGFIKFIFILTLIAVVIGGGVVAGIFFGLFGDDFDIYQDELIIGESNSVVVDKDGNVISNLSGDTKRKVITLEDMAYYVPVAYVAIEDERFYEHSGVDVKRTGGAIINTLLGGSDYGGSTITQQLVKNITGDDVATGVDGIIRKVKEWSKAYQVERMLSKDQILELYLNILYIGSEGNLHGVALGAEYYFNKSANELDLAESAYLAGINSSPNLYNPYILHVNFDTEEERNEAIKNKTLTVLEKMNELGVILTQEEYDAAVAKVEAGLVFTKGTASTASDNSYHTDAVVEQVIAQVMEEKGVTRQIAQNYVYSSGLTIYSTVDPAIQATIEAEYADSKYVITSYSGQTSESAFVMIDHKTGYVVGTSGGLGTKTVEDFYNRATQAVRQPGSTIKPIANIAPALNEGVITLGTTYYDLPTAFNNGTWSPKNDGGVYLSSGTNAAVGIRTILAKSQNVPQIKIMIELTPSKSIQYLRQMGITSLIDATQAAEHGGQHDEGLSLAIGGITYGISPLEMAAAYATIANDGVYIEPTFYTQVVDSDGNSVMTPTQETRRVFSEQTAYLTQSVLQDPVKYGTATYAAIPGMTVAAKTGTTDGSKDRWFCGFTEYYTSATWYGYDDPEEVRYYSHGNPAGQIWDSIMTKVHAPLANASFAQPSGIVTATVCRTTGGLAIAGCTDTYSEIFASNNLPPKCTGHGVQDICNISGKVATEHCLDVIQKTFGGVPIKEEITAWTPNGTTIAALNKEITEICDICKAPEPEPEPEPEPDEDEEDNENTTGNTDENNTSGNTSGNNTPGNTTGNNTSGNNVSGNETNTTP